MTLRSLRPLLLGSFLPIVILLNPAIPSSATLSNRPEIETSPASNLIPASVIPSGMTQLAQATDTNNLEPVPPGGIDTVSEDGFRYFRRMGALEYAARLGGIPDVPSWRVRIRLYPETLEDGTVIMRVHLNHYNLSPAVFRDLASFLGRDNVDASLNDRSSHHRWNLTFITVQNIAADWLDEDTRYREIRYSRDYSPNCSLGFSCTDVREPLPDLEDDGVVLLDAAPWESEPEPLYALVRALGQQAGWYSEDWGWTLPREQPEGLRDDPWVEVLVENSAGNGGGYTAEWAERVADDSVQSVVYGLLYDPFAGPEAYGIQGAVCGRGSVAGQLRGRCP